NEFPQHLRPETRRLIDSALEPTWQELKEDGPADVALAPRKLARTALVGETDPAKLKRFALHATRGMADSALGDPQSRSRGQQRSVRGGAFYAGRTQEHR